MDSKGIPISWLAVESVLEGEQWYREHTRMPECMIKYIARAGSNDTIEITAVKSGASADYTITVPAGNYTVTSLAQKLKEDIETQMDDGETNVTITYDRITNKYKFAISPATRSVTIHGATSSDLTNVILYNKV
eukprot:SAG22_NODE_492_length_9824_cov_12.256864_7_plen_134_part_00